MYRDRRGPGCLTLVVALIIAAGALWRYFSSEQVNAVTGKTQHVGISPQQEIALGIQAAPEMEQEYGGPADDPRGQAAVDRIGQQLASTATIRKSPYRLQYHLLADRNTINAFALPGGQVFITEALYRKLRTEGELAGVLGHETGHVIARHSAQQLAKQQLLQGLTGAAVLATYDPNDPNSRNSAAVAAAIAGLVNLKYSRNDELEADDWGVRLMAEAGYDPQAMIGVMKILEATAAGGHTPEFFSTHPNPENRIARIKQDIQNAFPSGIPPGLKP